MFVTLSYQWINNNHNDVFSRVAKAILGFSGVISTTLASAGARYRNIPERLLAGRDCTAVPWDASWTPENRAIEAKIMQDKLADEQVAMPIDFEKCCNVEDREKVPDDIEAWVPIKDL